MMYHPASWQHLSKLEMLQCHEVGYLLILAPPVSWGNIYLDLKSKSAHTKVVTEEVDCILWHSYAQIFFCKAVFLSDWHCSEWWKSGEHLIIQLCEPPTHRGNYHIHNTQHIKWNNLYWNTIFSLFPHKYQVIRCSLMNSWEWKWCFFLRPFFL